MTLPSSFGAILLGEMFSSCLCVNNEVGVDIEDVTVKVEMQTVSTKILLFETQASKLAAGDTADFVIQHEIKELGQHVLGCTVIYRSPGDSRHIAPGEENALLRDFSKFYKFNVTNPLSVKTKVHIPRAPHAIMTPRERDTVFLEIHVQNLTQNPIWFEKMVFDCTESWTVEDVNFLQPGVNIFSDSNALMQPQDMRQYMYVLRPVSPSPMPPNYPAGQAIPLGRLDLSWRSSFGEPGRLLTSMLTRRIPLPAQPPVSAVPPYLKRGTVASVPSRPSSPAQSRPSSPFRPRQNSTAASPLTPTQANLPSTLSFASDLQVEVILRDTPTTSIRQHTSISIPFTLVITALRPRTLSLVVQHVEPTALLRLPPPATPAHIPNDSLSNPAYSTLSPAQDKFNYALAQEKQLVMSPKSDHADLSGDLSAKPKVILPPPTSDSPNLPSTHDIAFNGASAKFFPPLDVTSGIPTMYDFELSYIPLKSGLVRVGGLRVLLMEDSYEEPGARSTAQILWRSDVVTELWVI